MRIVGIGGGFEYATAGVTHYGVEDVGVMRVQPGLTIVAPADHEQAAAALRATWNLNGPIYYRLGKDDASTVPGLNGRFDSGRRAECWPKGAICWSWRWARSRVRRTKRCRMLAARGVARPALIVVDTVNPPPVEQLRHALADVPVAMTVEAHYLVGGLGSLVSEIVAEHGLRCRVARCGVREMPVGPDGQRSVSWRPEHGLSAEGLGRTRRVACTVADRGFTDA